MSEYKRFYMSCAQAH